MMMLFIIKLFNTFLHTAIVFPSPLQPSDVLHTVFGMELESDHSLVIRDKHLVFAAWTKCNVFEAFGNFGHIVRMEFIYSHFACVDFGHFFEIRDMSQNLWVQSQIFQTSHLFPFLNFDAIGIRNELMSEATSYNLQLRLQCESLDEIVWESSDILVHIVDGIGTACENDSLKGNDVFGGGYLSFQYLKASPSVSLFIENPWEETIQIYLGGSFIRVSNRNTKIDDSYLSQLAPAGLILFNAIDGLQNELLDICGRATQIILRELATFLHQLGITERNWAYKNRLVFNHHDWILGYKLEEIVAPNLDIILRGTQPGAEGLAIVPVFRPLVLVYHALWVEL